MDLTSGAPYWPLKNALLGAYPSLRADERCDALVVGGGVTGALIAYYLSQAGLQTIVLDKREIGFGSTSASTALLLYELDVDLVDLEKLIGRQNAFHAYRLCRDALGKIENLTREIGDDCGFENKHSFYGASRKRDVEKLRQEYSRRREAGLRVEFLTQKELRKFSSFPHPAAILSHEAAQIDAFRFTHKLLEKSVACGAKIYDRTRLETYEQQGDEFCAQTNRGAQIRARHVVFATGYEVQEQLRQKIVDLQSTYVALTEPLPNFDGWPNGCLLWETSRPYLYLRTTQDGRAMIGGEDTLFKSEILRDKLLPKKAQKLMARFHELFPDIPARLDFAWAGTFGQTRDGLAYIGQTEEFPGAHFALGFGGNGITFSVIAAEIIRDTICGKVNPDAFLFRFGR
jgi:glycine/D-amino acid oxidase-like deaminating enzyme